MHKPHITPTNEEKIMDQNDFIVSKTDTKGIITYCNQIFMDMAGYKEDELIRVNHNLIRHPDMPQVAFKLAWDLIQSGKEFFGFVKNLQKNGGFYWVFAHITPDYDPNGNIIGYTSVRRKPPREVLPTIDGLYKQLRDAEAQGGMKASGELLMQFLEDNNTTYDELVLSLQGDR
ncbi:MAG: PAS domain-containing protein [Campylobacteraceae bacterium]|nr:PAS domain-containing protein [Campylobacteraceae bacterium]MBT3882474.1 PAS domain-containing protein [Campylobacteraceae bacterium]MBT4031063.1 PAS domain-containing protein [Campylobacteraceae bacterium]MBT4179892.1 PAS domain-containing protein [Campylobacteraceae bacterium]MBT4572413.1 PAS domain-containing protein [Campylobacteraceae bacterium]